MNGTIEIVGAGSEPAPTIPTLPTGMVAHTNPPLPSPTIATGTVPHTNPPLPSYNCNRNGRPYDPPLPSPLRLTAGEREAVYEAVINLVHAAREGTERVAMGYEWNNRNCRGGFRTRPYHPHNSNRNGRPYDTASAIAPTGHGAPYPDSVEHTRNLNHALRP